MILLQTGRTNTVELSLKEKSTLATPYYLFRFINDSSNVSTYFVSSDVSAFPERFNKFYITLSGSSSNLSAGTLVNLLHLGFSQYEIYEQVAQYNFNLTGTTSMVESGKLFVSGATFNDLNTVTYTGNSNSTKVVYFK